MSKIIYSCSFKGLTSKCAVSCLYNFYLRWIRLTFLVLWGGFLIVKNSSKKTKTNNVLFWVQTIRLEPDQTDVKYKRWASRLIVLSCVVYHSGQGSKLASSTTNPNAGKICMWLVILLHSQANKTMVIY